MRSTSRLYSAADPQQQIFKALKDKELLLLFDNFEQLAENIEIDGRELKDKQGKPTPPARPHPQSIN